MDEQEQALLADTAGRQPVLGDTGLISWDTLRSMAIGGLWGRPSTRANITGADPWVVRAEASR